MRRTLSVMTGAVLVGLSTGCGNSDGVSGLEGTVPTSASNQPVAASSLTIEKPRSPYLSVGQHSALTADVASTSDRRRQVSISWSSSNKDAIVISATGSFHAVGVGTSWLKARSTYGTDSVELRVLSSDNLTFTPAALSIVVGTHSKLDAGVDYPLTWRSSSAAIATVDETGSVVAVAPGTAIITAISPVGASASAQVNVSAAPVDDGGGSGGGGGPILPPPTGSFNVEAPRETLDQMVSDARAAHASRTINVSSSAQLQMALDTSKSGDDIVLAAGTTFVGNFTLPAKAPGNGWIRVRSASTPPAPGQRMTATRAIGTARVMTPNSTPAFQALPGSHHWHISGIEVTVTPGAGFTYGIVYLGQGEEATVSEQPANVVLDHLYIHGSINDGLQRCVTFNGRALAVVDSWLTECHAKGFDSQGVIGWAGPGPFLIDNNRIEGAGQAVMFGGADPKLRNVSPSDIVIRHNYMYKPLSWAGKWTVKATFELKHGKRVWFEGNVLENHWIDAQTGFAMLFQTLADQNTSWEWTTVQDIMVRNNIVKNSTGGVNALARVAYNGGQLPLNPTSRVAIVNNLFQDVGNDPINGTQMRLFSMLGDLRDVSVVNNTLTLNGQASIGVLFDGGITQRFVFRNNVLPNTGYAIAGSGLGIGLPAFTYYAPDGVFSSNVLPTASAAAYPLANFFPADASLIQFVSPGTGDFSLSTSNPFYRATDPIGVHMPSLLAQITGVVD